MTQTHTTTATNGSARNTMSVRKEYTKHVLQAHLQGFEPMSFRGFVAVVAAIKFAH